MKPDFLVSEFLMGVLGWKSLFKDPKTHIKAFCSCGIVLVPSLVFSGTAGKTPVVDPEEPLEVGVDKSELDGPTVSKQLPLLSSGGYRQNLKSCKVNNVTEALEVY